MKVMQQTKLKILSYASAMPAPAIAPALAQNNSSFSCPPVSASAAASSSDGGGAGADDEKAQRSDGEPD